MLNRIGDHVFLMEFRVASSQRTHPDAACASLEYKHSLTHLAIIIFVKKATASLQSVLTVYLSSITVRTWIFIQVIDWKKR